jgi:hypothetical protein
MTLLFLFGLRGGWNSFSLKNEAYYAIVLAERLLASQAVIFLVVGFVTLGIAVCSTSRNATVTSSTCKGARFESKPGHWLSWLRFTCLSSVPPGKCRHSITIKSTTASFQIRSNSLSFMYVWSYHFMPYCLEIEASLNKGKGKCIPCT